MKKFGLLLTISLIFTYSFAFAQGTEDFTNLPTTSSTSYLARTWTGTDGVVWNALGARTDQTLNGKAICWGTSGARNVVSPTYANGMGTLQFSYVRGFTGTNARSLEVYVNNNLQATITVSPTSNTVEIFNQNINISGNVILEIRSTGAAQVIVDDVSWNTFGGSIPSISVNPTSLIGFTYVVSSGSSTSQSYNLSGSNLIGFPGNITVTGSTNYDVSTDNSSFSGSVNVPFTSATLSSTPIYVRLKSGLSVGTYNGENISNAGGGATTQNVTCNGTVTPVLPDVVITEINDHPTFSYEYVEILNNSAYSVDLTGWKLLQLNSTQTTILVDDATNVLDGSLVLATGAYAIIFRGSSTDFANFKTSYNITGTINAYTNNKLSDGSGSPQMNGAETFRLEDNSGNLIDYFGDYLGGGSPLFSVTAGSLYERKDYPNNGTTIADWYTLTATSLGGTPALENGNPLPVELTSFSATTIGSTVKLSWNTATEVNNYGFEIERKVGSSQYTVGNYEKIGFVNGNGNSNSPKDYSFVDNKVNSGKYLYRLKQIDNDGQFEYSKTIEVDMNGVKKFELSQNYPNPFNPTTTIKFNLPEAGMVKLTLYNILGQQIRTLVNEFKESGTYTINFDASELNSGMYIYKIESGSFTQTRKMTLIK